MKFTVTFLQRISSGIFSVLLIVIENKLYSYRLFYLLIIEPRRIWIQPDKNINIFVLTVELHWRKFKTKHVVNLNCVFKLSEIRRLRSSRAMNGTHSLGSNQKFRMSSETGQQHGYASKGVVYFWEMWAVRTKLWAGENMFCCIRLKTPCAPVFPTRARLARSSARPRRVGEICASGYGRRANGRLTGNGVRDAVRASTPGPPITVFCGARKTAYVVF